MSVLNQKTIKDILEFNGIGLHSGKNVTMKLCPASPNTGIIFKRSDLKNHNIIYPSVFNVSSASYCTKITNEYGISVSTVEHLMAALCGLGIDNLLIDLNSEELPIMDGSAKNFVESIQKVGFEVSDQPIRIIKIDKKTVYSEGEKFISFEPNKISLEIDFEIKYKQNSILNQRNIKNIYMDDLNDMYESRTFCLFEDVEKLKDMGLAKGGSLDNAIVLKGNEVLNPEKLRNENEFVNHKILDLAGDFLLSGFRILGKVKCHQGGHELTNIFLRKLIKQQLSYSIIEDGNDILSKKIAPLNSIKIAANA